MLQQEPEPAPAPPPPAKWAVAAISLFKPPAFFVGWCDQGATTTTRWAGAIQAARLFESQDEAKIEAVLVAPSYGSRRVTPYRVPAQAEG